MFLLPLDFTQGIFNLGEEMNHYRKVPRNTRSLSRSQQQECGDGYNLEMQIISLELVTTNEPQFSVD